MVSRYDFMEESKTQVDPEDGVPYPDPLSVNYRSTQLTTIPKYVLIEQRYIDKFWLFMSDFYNEVEYDDILLTLNNVPYVGDLEPGDPMFLIKLDDLKNFNKQKQPGS